MLSDIRTHALLTEPTSVTRRPGYEGANIGTVIGFKHVYYLIEAAIIAHFRRVDLPVGRLYERHGLGFDVVEQSSRLQVALFVDDEVTVEVKPLPLADRGPLTFRIVVHVDRGGVTKKAVTATVAVVLRDDDNTTRMWRREPPPSGLERLVVKRIQRDPAGTTASVLLDHADGAGRPLTSGGSTEFDPVLDHLLAGRNAYGWKFRVPYPYVHFYERLQMSGYVRLMEEAKHRFVDARGISIGTLLAERNWIPAVSRSSLTLLDETLLEEDLYVVYTVEDVVKNLLYTARLDYHVVREGRLVRTATGTITHGYATVENGCEGGMVEWDDRIAAALRGEALRGEALRGEALSGEALSGEALSGEALSGEVNP